MIDREQQVEAVYAYIWRYLTEYDALPSCGQVAAVLGCETPDVTACVQLLRDAGRLSPTTLLPTAYREWWRNHIRVEMRWTLPGIIPLRRKLPRQTPSWR